MENRKELEDGIRKSYVISGEYTFKDNSESDKFIKIQGLV